MVVPLSYAPLAYARKAANREGKSFNAAGTVVSLRSRWETKATADSLRECDNKKSKSKGNDKGKSFERKGRKVKRAALMEGSGRTLRDTPPCHAIKLRVEDGAPGS